MSNMGNEVKESVRLRAMQDVIQQELEQLDTVRESKVAAYRNQLEAEDAEAKSDMTLEIKAISRIIARFEAEEAKAADAEPAPDDNTDDGAVEVSAPDTVSIAVPEETAGNSVIPGFEV